MRALELGHFGIDGLALVDRPTPSPGPGEVAIRIEAVSLNRRDLLLVEGVYNPKQKLPVVPVSDGAGVVVAVGAGVTDRKVGERVVAAFFPAWRQGDPTMTQLMQSRGGPGGDGLFQDVVIYPADGVLPIPEHMTIEEAACLPCAGLTAWSALVTLDGVGPGDVVLVQGTGGVSIFALRIAKMRGARVILATSSAEKAEKARALGADHVIDYVATPDWASAARALYPEGVDHIVEVGGGKTLDPAIRCVKAGGTISLVGVLSGPVAPVTLPLVVMRRVRLQGVTVGSVAEFRTMLDAFAEARERPVIGARFAVENYREAFAAMKSNAVFGKIVVSLA